MPLKVVKATTNTTTYQDKEEHLFLNQTAAPFDATAAAVSHIYPFAFPSSSSSACYPPPPPPLPPSSSSSSSAAIPRLTYDRYLQINLERKAATRPSYSSDDEEEEEKLRVAGFRSAFRFSQPRLIDKSSSLTSRVYYRPPPLIKQWGAALAQCNNTEMLCTIQLQDDAAPSSASPSSSKRPSSKSESKYWIYASPRVKRIGKDVGYSVCDHSWYRENKPLRASPSFASSELSSLIPVTAIEACRQNHITILRQMRVKVKNETLAELNRVMKSVTGEIDMKVLRMCETGELSKVQIYKTDDYNYTLISTEKILSGEPLGCWMGTLREKNTFVQRVGFESSFLHVCSYEINAKDLPDGYEGPDLVVDASMYGNESRFFRDPKWSHQQADANITCRISWNQLTGLPYLVYVALADIPPHAELFLDWGDKCWMNIWRTQLTALSTNSHLSHQYLKTLQRICIDRGINPLPQLTNSKFAIAPLPFDKENEEKNQFLDEELSPFASTSATTLSKKIKVAVNEDASGRGVSMAATVDGANSATEIPTPFITPTPSLGDISIPLEVSFDHQEADAKAAVSGEPDEAKDSMSSQHSSTPSSPFTPSFNNHKAFCASTSHTMLTVFARAMLDAQTREQFRMRRRLERHRLNQYRPKRKPVKPLLEGAMHVKGHHTFEIVSDPSIAFLKSGTRLGRESKVAVSEATKEMVAEAFRNLRSQDFPTGKDAAIIESGCVPKAAIYEVVGLKHPARFFTRPDQSPFCLVATADIPKSEAIGAYLGVFREFEEFHKVSDSDAMKQVFAYDCLANKIPGPPNPFLNEEQKAVPKESQLAYRGEDLVVESLYYGNEIRFMNDAYGRSGMDGTVNARATIMWDKEREWPCIIIQALHAIPKGDEIVCDYGDDFWNKVSRSLMMDHAAYGDEVQQLIEQTESWIKAHGLSVPLRPRNASELPEVFTQNTEKDIVIYPRFFLKPVASDLEGCLLTAHQASDALRLSKRNMIEEKKGRGRPRATQVVNSNLIAPQAAAATTSTTTATMRPSLDPGPSPVATSNIINSSVKSPRVRQTSLKRTLEGAVQNLHQKLLAAAESSMIVDTSDSDANDSGDELPLFTALSASKGKKRKSVAVHSTVDESSIHPSAPLSVSARPMAVQVRQSLAPSASNLAISVKFSVDVKVQSDKPSAHPTKLLRLD